MPGDFVCNGFYLGDNKLCLVSVKESDTDRRPATDDELLLLASTINTYLYDKENHAEHS